MSNKHHVQITIDEVLVGAISRLLRDTGWEKVVRGQEKNIWAKDGREFVLTPGVAYALWDVYGVDDGP